MKKLLLGIVAVAALLGTATASYAQWEDNAPAKPWTISAGALFHNDDVATGVTVKNGWSLAANYTFGNYESSEAFVNLQTDFYRVETTIERKDAYSLTPHVGYRFFLDTEKSIYIAPSAGITYSKSSVAGYEKSLTDISASLALGLKTAAIRAEIYWNAIPGHNLNDAWGIKVGYRL